MVACPICKGKGCKSTRKGSKKCFFCKGTGQVTTKSALTAIQWKLRNNYE